MEQDCFSLVNENVLKPSHLNLTFLKNIIFDNKINNFRDLFIQKTNSENYILEDNKVKHIHFDIEEGIGIRSISNQGNIGFAHSDNLSMNNIKQLAKESSKYLPNNKLFTKNNLIKKNNLMKNKLYENISPFYGLYTEDKIDFLHIINSYAKSLDHNIEKVTISLSAKQDIVLVLNNHGVLLTDIRPLIRLNINIIMSINGKRESFSSGGGGRCHYNFFLKNDLWKKYVHEAYKGVKNNLNAEYAPNGKMPVILGSGWPAVLLHEAIGHGLEGDFNYKKNSYFCDKMGKKVAYEGCTIIDDGSIKNARGSLNFDDEGVETQKTILIKNGILKSYIHDRISAKKFHVNPTGNGRRESYAHLPLPRMTTTYMLPGKDKLENMIESIDFGVYATHFNGGQVDPTSGQFVFVMDQAFLIKNGKIVHPIKGASLVGHGSEVMKNISMIGKDFNLDPGVGMCSKEGQIVPVGVGQPSLKINEIILGGH